MNATLYVLGYLKSSHSRGLYSPTSGDFTLSTYCDVDWAFYFYLRKSFTDFCVFLGGSLIFWKIKKLYIVSRSFAEAEYRALASVVCELLCVHSVLQDFQIIVPLPVSLHCDNKVAIHIAVNLVFHEHIKHFNIDCQIVRDELKCGFIAPQHVFSKLQLADICIK